MFDTADMQYAVSVVKVAPIKRGSPRRTRRPTAVPLMAHPVPGPRGILETSVVIDLGHLIDVIEV